MKRTVIFFTAMAATMFLVVISVFDFSKPRPKSNGAPPAFPETHPIAPQPTPTQVLTLPSKTNPPSSVSWSNVLSPPRPVDAGIATKVMPASAASPTANQPVHDPVARAALALVGVDATAEEYWLDAINDPTLSAQERQDLIEDLNEVGFADPTNPGPDDLPLIVSRLQIIEENAPFALDTVNAAAFEEAFKDLWNMYVRLTRQ